MQRWAVQGVAECRQLHQQVADQAVVDWSRSQSIHKPTRRLRIKTTVFNKETRYKSYRLCAKSKPVNMFMPSMFRASNMVYDEMHEEVTLGIGLHAIELEWTSR